MSEPRFLYTSGKNVFTPHIERENLLTKASNILDMIRQAESKIADMSHSIVSYPLGYDFIQCYRRHIADLERAIPRLKSYLNKTIEKAKF
jgi:hypothetical protein